MTLILIIILVSISGFEASKVLPEDILSRYPGQDDYISPTTFLETVAATSAFLPCNLTSPFPNDPAVLVLWYKNGIVKPIYSYDLRSGLPTHWKSERHLGSRGTFDASRGSLILQRVVSEDKGIYRCRVDFKTNPTLSYSVNLTVIIPPKRFWIVTEDGEEASSIVGPYRENDRVLLTCKVSGGHPSPTVTWKEGRKLIDEIIERKRSQQVANTLMIERVTRSDLHRTLTCTARNTRLTAPLKLTVSLDMIFPPIDVSILKKDVPLSAGRRYKLECEAVGSRPKADMGWTLNDRPLLTHTERASDEGNVTVSTLIWTPNIEDSGKTLVCKASSPAIEKILEDQSKIIVHYPPIVSLRPGVPFDISNIEEGDDIFFECQIEAVPKVTNVIWLLNDKQLHHNVSVGIILSNYSLVLQRVERTASGNYACRASNSEGETMSKVVALKVKYVPVCRTQQELFHGAARHEQVHIPCHLDAHPMPNAFTWTFNNSGESVKIPQDHVKVEGYSSTVSYTPMTELDYGTLLCWGKNVVGGQTHPCVFHVFPAGRPDPVHNCSQFNLSDSAVNIRCSPGFDGGLPQTFILELYDNHSSRLVANVSHEIPVLSVSELEAATSFAAVIYSTNEKGSGERFRLQTYTLKDNAEKRTAAIKPAPTANGEKSEFSPIIVIGLGAVGGLVLVVLLLVVALRVRQIRNRQNREGKPTSSSETVNTSTSLAPIIIKEPFHHSPECEEQNPDLIPHAVIPSWHDHHVRTISSSSLVGSYATLPRRMPSQGHCQEFQTISGVYPEPRMIRTPSLHSTCSKHGDHAIFSSLDCRRSSQPLVIPPPPPEFASSSHRISEECSSLWHVRHEKVPSHWIQSPKSAQNQDPHFAGGISKDSPMNNGQHESSV